MFYKSEHDLCQDKGTTRTTTSGTMHHKRKGINAFFTQVLPNRSVQKISRPQEPYRKFQERSLNFPFGGKRIMCTQQHNWRIFKSICDILRKMHIIRTANLKSKFDINFGIDYMTPLEVIELKVGEPEVNFWLSI